MLDFGFSEILLTSVIAPVVLGPERLPKVARQIGNWVGRARVLSRQLSEQLEREVSAEELLRQRSRPASPAANAQPATTAAPDPMPAAGPEADPSAAAHPADAAAPAAEATPSIRPPND